MNTEITKEKVVVYGNDGFCTFENYWGIDFVVLMPSMIL